MITSIFKKSKPINFTFVFFAVFLSLLLGWFKYRLLSSFLQCSIVFFSIIFSILILYFIVNKNKLTRDCNFEILIFSLFVLALPQVFQNTCQVISNLLILLALRRILGLRSQKTIIKKVFDATLLIALASLFSFWAILFLPLVFFALFLYSHHKINYWLVPFLGLASVGIITLCYSIIFKKEFLSFLELQTQVSFVYSPYNHLQFIIFITTLFSFSIWSSIFFFKAIKNKTKESKIAHKIILFMVLCAFILSIISPQKDGSEFVFLFAPVAILISGYLEIIEDRWFKNLFLLTLISMPFLLIFLN